LYSQEKVILDENNPYKRIGRSVYYLEDPKKELQFSDISNKAFESKFIKSEQDANNLGNVDMAVWNKFTITNPTRKKWLLAIESYNVDIIEFYYPDSLTGEYRMIRSGRHLPFSSRKYKTNFFVFDLPLLESTATFYLKVESFYMQYPMSVYTEEEFVKQSHQKDLLTGVYYGLVLVFMLYNLFVFFSVRDKNYLYYIVYIFFNALLIAQLKGLTAELFGDRLHFFWAYSPAIVAVTSVFSFIFTRHILETKHYTPKWDKVITRIFFPNYALIILLSIVGQNLYASLLNQFSGMLALIFLFTIGISVYRKGFKPARFYIIATFFYFLGVLIYVLKGFNVLPFNDFTNSAIEVGSTLQMVMFAFVIGDRLKIFKKEKENAQTELVASLQENEKLILEQNQFLEIKVTERTQELQSTLQDLTKEKKRSDELLLNILPYETAEELKEKGKSEPKFFPSVTIMFTDFKDFTRISEKLSPEELVSEIDYCFGEFDRIISIHGIEKIKTIGDSYMAAGGLPVPGQTHAKDVVKAAIAIQQFINQYNQERSAVNKALFEIRIGIHTGSVVAGIVGSKKFAYDIWGDAVNTASRMETSGEPGKINISGVTYELVKDEFNFVYRGKVVAKNKGEIDMYFLD
jgi:class 3 adenylate cyclase